MLLVEKMIKFEKNNYQFIFLGKNNINWNNILKKQCKITKYCGK